MPRPIILILLFTLPLVAQPADDKVVVLAGVAGPSAGSALLEVDTATGTTVPLGSFAAASFPPLALTWDPVNGDLIVAVLEPTMSRIVRLTFQGTAVLTERSLATLNAPVTDLAIEAGGAIIASTDGPTGGVWRIPRNGGVPVQIASLPFTTAMDVPYGIQAIAVQSLPTGDPILSFVPLGMGGVLSFSVTGLAGLRITGVVDFPTGAIRQGLSDDQGGLHRFEFLNTVTPWIMPPLPVGATNELALDPISGAFIAVGGAASPFIRSLPIFGSTAATVAGPLTGDPIDMTVTGPAGARYTRFGPSCSGGSITWASFPSLGASIVIGLQGGFASSPSVLAFGLSDQAWSGFGLALPLSIPGGCSVLVSVDNTLNTTSDATGAAQFGFTIPNDPTLSGTVVFGQWGQITPAGVWQTSAALAAHIR